MPCLAGEISLLLCPNPILADFVAKVRCRRWAVSHFDKPRPDTSPARHRPGATARWLEWRMFSYQWSLALLGLGAASAIGKVLCLPLLAGASVVTIPTAISRQIAPSVIESRFVVDAGESEKVWHRFEMIYCAAHERGIVLCDFR